MLDGVVSLQHQVASPRPRLQLEMVKEERDTEWRKDEGALLIECTPLHCATSRGKLKPTLLVSCSVEPRKVSTELHVCRLRHRRVTACPLSCPPVMTSIAQAQASPSAGKFRAMCRAACVIQRAHRRSWAKDGSQGGCASGRSRIVSTTSDLTADRPGAAARQRTASEPKPRSLSEASVEDSQEVSSSSFHHDRGIQTPESSTDSADLFRSQHYQMCVGLAAPSFFSACVALQRWWRRCLALQAKESEEVIQQLMELRDYGAREIQSFWRCYGGRQQPQ